MRSVRMHGDVGPARQVEIEAELVPGLIGGDEIRRLERALLELDIADHNLVAVDAALARALHVGDFRHLDLFVAELAGGEEVAVRPAEDDARERALRLQLGEEHELALVGFAAVEDVLVEERADGGVRGARLGGDLLDLLLDRRDDLRIDRIDQLAAVRFRRARPKHVHGAGRDDDRAEHEKRQSEADSNAQATCPRCGRDNRLAVRAKPAETQ